MINVLKTFVCIRFKTQKLQKKYENVIFFRKLGIICYSFLDFTRSLENKHNNVFFFLTKTKY